MATTHDSAPQPIEPERCEPRALWPTCASRSHRRRVRAAAAAETRRREQARMDALAQGWATQKAAREAAEVRRGERWAMAACFVLVALLALAVSQIARSW